MTMKKILMAAVAVSALTAGSAFAAQLSSASTVGGQALTLGTGTYDPFTIANEVDAPGQLVAALTVTPSTTGIRVLIGPGVSSSRAALASSSVYSGRGG